MQKLWNILIVLLVVLLVFGLVLPAVFKVREADARTRSNDRLHLCALANLNFHDTHRKFAPAFGPDGRNPDEPKSMWFHLLPFVQADEVHKAGQTDAFVTAFILPSDPSLGDGRGTISVAANIRVFGFQTIGGRKCNEVGGAIDVPQGVLISGLTMGRLTSMDGTSNTFMLSTRYAHCDGRPTWYAADPHGLQLADRTPAGVGGFMGAGSATKPATRERSTTATFQILPLPENCVADTAIYGHSFGLGGMSTAMCDGSVKNVSPTMSAGAGTASGTNAIFTRALCPGDGATLGPPELHDD